MVGETMQVQSESEPVVDPNRLRLWPALVLVAAMWLVRLLVIVTEFAPWKFFFGLVLTPLAVVVGMICWTLLGSRLTWSDRLLLVGTLVGMTAFTMVVAGGDFPVIALILYAAPIVCTVWAGWLLLTLYVGWPIRRVGVLLVFVVTGAVCSQLRVEGMDGTFEPKFSWRWNPTAEQLHLSELKSRSAPVAKAIDVAIDHVKPGDWPEFRGPLRDGRLAGVKIETNWTQSPPRELWRHRIGPGWSSLAVIGNQVFTQEQRGDEEYVVCYDGETGAELWIHHDPERFTEVVAGAGPRATPTFHEGRLYAMGASGKLNCLNAATGQKIWTQDLVKDTTAKIPTWGFSSSPLVAGGIVTVFAGGPQGKTLVGYKADTGEFAWTAGEANPKTPEEGELSYCSPHLATILGVDQLLMSTSAGLFSFDPATGKTLWTHDWPCTGIARVCQPALIGKADLLIGTGMGVGTRRITVSHVDDKWTTEAHWTSRDIKPYYNDLVLQGDHLYGFDGNIFVCINLQDGTRTWRARGYGNGQVLLLADQALLLILSEQGDVALVRAQPQSHEELGRFKAIEGKTWNHPVVAHGKLYVRNAEEIACFKLEGIDTVKETIKAVDQTTVKPADSE